MTLKRLRAVHECRLPTVEEVTGTYEYVCPVCRSSWTYFGGYVGDPQTKRYGFLHLRTKTLPAVVHPGDWWADDRKLVWDIL